MSISLTDAQRAGFPMGGEPVVALDLVDTELLAADQPADLLADPTRLAAWWRLQATRLPPSPPPDPVALRRLRAALRALFDAQLGGTPADPTAVDDLNAAAAAVPTSPRLVLDATGHPTTELRWHPEHGGNPALAAIAREAITLLGDPARLARLRRCANPTCSMLFLADTARRRWCASNTCGNRTRVARHYHRTRTTAT